MSQAKLKMLGLSLKPGEAIDRSEAIRMAMEIGGSSRYYHKKSHTRKPKGQSNYK